MWTPLGSSGFSTRLSRWPSRPPGPPPSIFSPTAFPQDVFDWTFYRKGRVLYIELKISGTGGDCELAGLECLVEQEETTF